MQLDNLPLIVPNGKQPWQDHQEKFELFDLSRRKLLLTLYLILLSKKIASS